MGTISITQFSNGTTADANQVNADLNAIGNVINGNLDDTNISASAGINGSKILAGSLPTTALLNVDGWIPSGESWAYGANNGNKEYTVTVAGDKTGKYSPGMKVKLPRTVTPPTQAMSFVAASSQYATKASPTGITFTTTFSCEAWVYLNSYGAWTIINRYDATPSNGWSMFLTAAGQVYIDGRSAGAARQNNTYQSLPLKRWVHVAASMNMTTGAAAVYFNGTLVPSVQAGAATTITQTGNLSVAANGGLVGFFDGFLSEIRVWSTTQTQAQIQANMNINLVGNENNLVALFQGNGNFNDANANGNSLTAVNGATFATATNPYNAIEYGIITKAAYANPTTTLTLFTGTDNNIPNQTLGSPSYSLHRSPFGFNAAKTRWQIVQLYKVPITQNTPSAAPSTWYNLANAQISVPTGEWAISYVWSLNANIGSGNSSLITTLSTSTSSASDILMNSEVLANSTNIEFSLTNTGFFTQTVQGQLYMISGTYNALTALNLNSNNNTSKIVVECAYI